MPSTIRLPSSALVVLMGAAGSGKSTFAHANFRATEILSSDRFRGLVSDDEGDQSATADAFALLHLVLEKRLKRGKLCVVDATNIRPDFRSKLVAMAAQFRRPAIAILFDTPEKTCIQRAKARIERPVSGAVVQKQLRDLKSQSEENLLAEGFRRAYRVTPDEKLSIKRRASKVGTA